MQIGIRPLAPADEAPFVASARRSRRLHGSFVRVPLSAEAFGRYFRYLSSDGNLGFAVYLKSTSEVVGAVHLTGVVLDLLRCGYVDYFVFAGHERKGYMTQALALVRIHAFRRLKLHRLEACIEPGNLASKALVARTGFEFEGLSRSYLKLGGRWRDCERWALINERGR